MSPPKSVLFEIDLHAGFSVQNDELVIRNPFYPNSNLLTKIFSAQNAESPEIHFLRVGFALEIAFSAQNEEGGDIYFDRVNPHFALEN